MKYLSRKAVLKCVHEGDVRVAVSDAPIMIGGEPILCAEDLLGAPIQGCTQPNSPGSKQCLSVTSIVSGRAGGILVGGKTPLFSSREASPWREMVACDYCA